MEISEIVSYSLFAFTSFIALINPLGTVPVFVSMSAELSNNLKRKMAFKATLTAFIALSIFAFAGQLLFNFFGISVNGFRIAGGIIFFVMGYEMLNARVSQIKYDDKDVETKVDDFAITPLGIPMIAGPGSITNAIVLMDDAHTIYHKIALPIAIFLVLLITFIALVASTRIVKWMGPTGNKIMLKLMGLIVMVVAVEFFFKGLKPIIQDILIIQAL
jgi:multiple antibiotic resistance protein